MYVECFVSQAPGLVSVRSVTGLNCIPVPEKSAYTTFGLGSIAFSLLPLSPEAVGRRKTILTEVVPGKVYTLDQRQGIINVDVPVRATIIKLKDGLFVHNPVAPTPEALSMVKTLERQLGAKVKYIALATLGIEHKGTCGAFAAKFPGSTIFIQPGQYSFPLQLPQSFFFPPTCSIQPMPESSREAPWGGEVDHAILGPLKPPGVGGFSETAFFHRDTKTLILTDTIVDVRDEPPAIIAEDPRALLYHARDTMFDVVENSPANRRKGWRRMTLFGLTFQPAGIDIKDTFETLKLLDKVPAEMKKLGEGAIPFDGGFYPWEWVEDDKPSFDALKDGLLVAPILQKLILNRDPEIVLAWADRVAQWPFTRIIPCHFANDIRAGPAEFRRAFNFLEEDPANGGIGQLMSALGLTARSFKAAPRALPRDGKLLSDASESLTEKGVLYPEAPLVKRS